MGDRFRFEPLGTRLTTPAPPHARAGRQLAVLAGSFTNAAAGARAGADAGLPQVEWRMKPTHVRDGHAVQLREYLVGLFLTPASFEELSTPEGVTSEMAHMLMTFFKQLQAHVGHDLSVPNDGLHLRCKCSGFQRSRVARMRCRWKAPQAQQHAANHGGSV